MAFGQKNKETSGVFDQDAAEIVPSGPIGAIGEVIERPKLPAMLGDYTPRSADEAKFLELLCDLDWVESEGAGLRMALQIAEGDPDKAGEAMETRSVKNLRLANKVHVVTGFALSLSSFYDPASASSCPVYAQVEAVTLEGEPFSYSIGGWKPIGQLRAKAEAPKAGKNGFPWRVVITELATDKGNAAYSYADA